MDTRYQIRDHRDTVAMIEQIARQAASHPSIIRKARDIVRHVPERDRRGEIEALGRWVRAHVRYTFEGTETLQNPVEMLQEIEAYGMATEDCDGHVALYSALALSLGHSIRYHTVSQRGDGRMTHIYVEDLANGRWVAVDLIQKNKPIGWSPQKGVSAREVQMPKAPPPARGCRRRPDAFRHALNGMGSHFLLAEPMLLGIEEFLGSGANPGELLAKALGLTSQATKAAGIDASKGTVAAPEKVPTPTSSTRRIQDALIKLAQSAPKLYKTYEQRKAEGAFKDIAKNREKILADIKQIHHEMNALQTSPAPTGTVPVTATGEGKKTGGGKIGVGIVVGLLALFTIQQMKSPAGRRAAERRRQARDRDY
jgi:hypothetical protein